MNSNHIDLSILNDFGFKRKPVGINFLLQIPDGVKRLGKQLALCEMIQEAQEDTTPFYTDIDNHVACGGPMVLGYHSIDDENRNSLLSYVESGRLGPKYGIFKHQVPNRRTLQALPRFTKDTVNYVQFTPFDCIDADPEVLIISANPNQAEIIMRAYSFITGSLWESKSSSILGCSWLFAYPHLTGKLNFLITGLYFGMVGRKIWPDGEILISIPYDVIPMITQNLQEMTWELSSYKGANRDEYMVINKSIHQEVYKEIEDYESQNALVEASKTVK